MRSDVAKGLLAGAVGTVALNVTTYVDMAVRGRSSSHVPGEDVNVLLHDIGIELPSEARERLHEQQPVAHGRHEYSEHRQQEGSGFEPQGRRPGQASDGQSHESLGHGDANARKWPESSVAQNRLTGLGALVGYGVGLGVGVAYSLARPLLRNVPAPVAGVVVGLAAMAGSDVPSVLLGVTNPRKWGFAGWVEDIIPHVIYGLITVGVYEALRQAEQPAKRSWRPW